MDIEDLARTEHRDRVKAVQAICRRGPTDEERHWLLRHSCEDPLACYYAGEVAVAADLRGAITVPEPDEELITHTMVLLRELWTMTGGMTLAQYPDAEVVVEAFLRHLDNLTPDPYRQEHLDELLRAAGETPLAEAVLEVMIRPEWAVWDDWIPDSWRHLIE